MQNIFSKRFFETQVFNVGAYRRKLGLAGVDNTFFEKDNEKAIALRTQMAETVQNEMYEWLYKNQSQMQQGIQSGYDVFHNQKTV